MEEVNATEIVNEAAMSFGAQLVLTTLAEVHNGELHHGGQFDPKRAEFSIQELDGVSVLRMCVDCIEHKSTARIGWRQDVMLDLWLRTFRETAASRLGGRN